MSFLLFFAEAQRKRSPVPFGVCLTARLSTNTQSKLCKNAAVNRRRKLF